MHPPEGQRGRRDVSEKRAYHKTDHHRGETLGPASPLVVLLAYLQIRKERASLPLHPGYLGWNTYEELGGAACLVQRWHGSALSWGPCYTAMRGVWRLRTDGSAAVWLPARKGLYCIPHHVDAAASRLAWSSSANKTGRPRGERRRAVSRH